MRISRVFKARFITSFWLPVGAKVLEPEVRVEKFQQIAKELYGWRTEVITGSPGLKHLNEVELVYSVSDTSAAEKRAVSDLNALGFEVDQVAGELRYFGLGIGTYETSFVCRATETWSEDEAIERLGQVREAVRARADEAQYLPVSIGKDALPALMKAFKDLGIEEVQVLCESRSGQGDFRSGAINANTHFYLAEEGEPPLVTVEHEGFWPALIARYTGAQINSENFLTSNAIAPVIYAGVSGALSLSLRGEDDTRIGPLWRHALRVWGYLRSSADELHLRSQQVSRLASGQVNRERSALKTARGSLLAALYQSDPEIVVSESLDRVIYDRFWTQWRGPSLVATARDSIDEIDRRVTELAQYKDENFQRRVAIFGLVFTFLSLVSMLTDAVGFLEREEALLTLGDRLYFLGFAFGGSLLAFSAVIGISRK